MTIKSAYSSVKGKGSSISTFVRILQLYFVLLVLGAMNIGIFGSLLKLYVLGLSAYGLLDGIISRKTIIMTPQLKYTGIYVLLCFLSLLWTVDYTSTGVRSITQSSFFFLLVIVSMHRYNQFEIASLRKSLIWSSRITVLVVLLFGQYSHGRLYLSGLIAEDPNYLCAYFLYGIISAIDELASITKQRKKVMAGIEICIYLYVIFSTGSRGGLLAVLVAALYSLLFLKTDNTMRRKRKGSRIFVIVIVAITLMISESFIDSTVLNRFSVDSVISSQGTGRYQIWSDALRIYSESGVFRCLFGYGTATSRVVLDMGKAVRVNVIHNMFIETLLELGIIGLVSYFLFIFSYLWFSIKQRDVFVTSVLVGMIVLSLSTSIYAFKPYWNIMLFIICISRYRGKNLTCVST